MRPARSGGEGGFGAPDGPPRSRRCVTTLVVAAFVAACAPPMSTGEASRPEVDVLFVGNSLTAANDLPGMVAEIARREGRELSVASITSPGASLEDHWNAGVAGRIERVGADVVLLQQGPSSLPANREHLVRWSRRYAETIRGAGGRPVLLMVWPPRSRWEALEDVAASYAAAARAVDGLLAPAGEVLGAALAREPVLPLLGPDGFHPTPLGTFASALTVFAVVSGRELAELPCPELAGTAAGRVAVCAAVREVLSGTVDEIEPRSVQGEGASPSSTSSSQRGSSRRGASHGSEASTATRNPSSTRPAATSIASSSRPACARARARNQRVRARPGRARSASSR